MNASTLTNDSGGREAAASSLARAEAARERAGLYRLLASLFQTEPSRETLLSFRDRELREALQQAGMKLEGRFFTEPVETLFDELAVDFADLFLLPGIMISPHEAVQIDGGSGLLRGPETAVVRDYYERVGFAVDDSSPMEPDHISIELEFLGHLADEEADGWEKGDRTKGLDAIRYQEDFLQRHLGRWVFSFLDRVAGQAGTDFYRELAALTHSFLTEQRESLPQYIDQLQS